MQDPTDLLYRECIIEWENDTAVDIMVYNRRFRERNFKENIAGVFTLGQATIEDIRALEEMKEQRAKKNEDYTTRGNTLQKKLQEEIAYKATFRDTVWERILKPNEADFQEAFSGFRNNKERFRDEVLRRYQISHSSTETRDALLVRAKTLFARKPEKCPIIPFVLDNIVEQIAEIETAAIWSKVIVGNRDLPIGRLIEVLDNADWVSQGSSLVKGLIKDVREGNSDVEQIFILTHNVFFHKETAFIDRTIPDDLYIDSYTDSIDRYKQIFKEVFFKMGHEAHYKMMMGES